MCSRPRVPALPRASAARFRSPQLIGHGAGVLSDYSDAAGRAVVGLATPLGRTGWFLAVETEHARAFAPAIALTRTIFILDVCIVLLFSVLAYKVTVAIMQPIHALSRGAQRILDGHVDHQIPAARDPRRRARPPDAHLQCDDAEAPQQPDRDRARPASGWPRRTTSSRASTKSSPSSPSPTGSRSSTTIAISRIT